MTTRLVRERIDPRLTASLFANYRSATDAILELLDNAIDSRIDGQPLKVDLAIRAGSIVLTAVGGRGMGAAELERDYLRWGASRKRAGDQIGRFGQGGKAAIGYLGDRFTIVASRSGDTVAVGFEDATYRDRSRLRSYELRERPKPVAAEFGYVRIEIGGVDRPVDRKRLPARLAEVYRPLLEAGSIVITVDRAPVAPAAIDLEERHDISVRAGGRLVRGWYGLLPEASSRTVQPGIRLFHLGRLVGPPEWFGHHGPALHPELGRLVGEIELPHVPVTTNKSDVDRDSPAFLAVEARLHTLLAPVVRRLTREDAARADPGALRTADRVRRILARALRLLESGQLFESDPGTGAGEGPGRQLTLEASGRAAQTGEPEAEVEPAIEAEPVADQENEPGSPAPQPMPRPPREAGSGRGRGAAEVVVRALDPRLRSAMVVEDGVRRVVINSRYPLYEVRRGDLWYQLETALREVCVTIPEATIPEFERKVNELMVVSLALTERRRRRSIPGRRQAGGRQASARLG
ncbi:MAG: ATP-binding protein [Candidatus Limnocylindrales bacterium]